MKNNIIIAIASIAMMFCASCEKSLVAPEKEVGYLSFSEFSLGVDESVDTRATVGRNYSIKIYDANEDVVVDTTYGAVTDSDKNISLTAGEYTLVASSYDGEDVPIAEFEQPIYGVSHPFTIVAGEETPVGELTCTLLQCKVTVAYSDDFLKNVKGAGKTTVTVTAGHSLDYALNYNYEDDKCAYDQSAGYFAVSGSNPTMTVVFSGNYDGKSAKMTKTFTGIAAKQWRQIKFIPVINKEGDATFDIVITDLVDDETLNSGVSGSEDTIGEDPDAPKGDGGITLVPDYAAGCDEDITDLENIVIKPIDTPMSIKFKATVPGGVKKFTVDITSTSTPFTNAVAAATDKGHLDLINPSETNAVIFEVVPFPHGSELVGQTDIPFDLSAAQGAIINYKGTHTFSMTIVDQEGCRKTIIVKMVVE